MRAADVVRKFKAAGTLTEKAVYVFPLNVEISGNGDTEQEAWDNAISQLARRELPKPKGRKVSATSGPSGYHPG